VMNHEITENLPNVRKYIDALCSLPKHASPDRMVVDIDKDRVLCQLHHVISKNRDKLQEATKEVPDLSGALTQLDPVLQQMAAVEAKYKPK